MAFWSQSSGLGVGREEEEEEADMASQLFRLQPASVFSLYPFLPAKHPHSPALLRVIPVYGWARLL